MLSFPLLDEPLRQDPLIFLLICVPPYTATSTMLPSDMAFH